MTTFRRLICLTLLLGACTIAISGCSSSEKHIGAVGGLIAAHHFTSAKTYHKIACGYHTYRAVHDIKHGYKAYGALQGALAARQCYKVVKGK